MSSRPDFCLGIDPGLSGSLALLDLGTRKIHTIWDMPTKDGTIYPGGVAMVVDMAKSIASAQLVAVVENVNSRPGQAHMWAFALGVGIIHGCLGALDVPFHLVAPQQWKSSFGLRRVGDESQAGTKARAREIAARLWPDNANLFARVKDADRAEAALLARFFCTKQGWV